MPISPQDEISASLLQALIEDPKYRGVTANLLSLPRNVRVHTVGYLPNDVAGQYSSVLSPHIDLNPRRPDGNYAETDAKDTLAHELMHYVTALFSDDPVVQRLGGTLFDKTDLHRLIYEYGTHGTGPRGERSVTTGPLRELTPGGNWEAPTEQVEIPPDPALMELIHALLSDAIQSRHETTMEALK